MSRDVFADTVTDGQVIAACGSVAAQGRAARTGAAPPDRRRAPRCRRPASGREATGGQVIAACGSVAAQGAEGERR